MVYSRLQHGSQLKKTTATESEGHMKSILFLKNGLLGLAAAGLLLAASATAKANSAVYQQTLHSTAWVLSPVDANSNSTGTGVLVDAQRRLLVTNFHVVEQRKDVVVFFPSYEDGEPVALSRHYTGNFARLGIKGKVLVAEPKRDLAVIQLDRLPAGVQAIPLARRSIGPGALIHGIGNSDSNNGTLWRYNSGPVRGVFPKRITSGNKNVKQFTIEAKVIESQMATNPGDSGGPIVNDSAELVGIHHGNANGQLLVSFAIDITEVKSILSSVTSSSKAASSDEEEVAARPADEQELPPAKPVDEAPLRGIGGPKEVVEKPLPEPKPLPESPVQEPKPAPKPAPKLDEELPAVKPPTVPPPIPEPAVKKSIFDAPVKPVVVPEKPLIKPVVKPVIKPVIKPSHCEGYGYVKRGCH
jgi:S1-C subfamily serine protease